MGRGLGSRGEVGAGKRAVLVYGVVEALGGLVGVRSKGGRGTANSLIVCARPMLMLGLSQASI